jgi:hypothetical protein
MLSTEDTAITFREQNSSRRTRYFMRNSCWFRLTQLDHARRSMICLHCFLLDAKLSIRVLLLSSVRSSTDVLRKLTLADTYKSFMSINHFRPMRRYIIKELGQDNLARTRTRPTNGRKDRKFRRIGGR